MTEEWSRQVLSVLAFTRQVLGFLRFEWRILESHWDWKVWITIRCDFVVCRSVRVVRGSC